MFSIVPVSGKDFTERVATPFDANWFEFVVFQCGRVNERIRDNPRGSVCVEVRPDGPGGDSSRRGAIELRGVLQILTVGADGIRAAPEFGWRPICGQVVVHHAEHAVPGVGRKVEDATIPISIAK